MPRSISLRHVLLVLAATACWGSGTVLSKQVLDRGVAPLTLLVIELAASSLVLSVGLLAVRARWSWSPATARLTALGLLNPGLSYMLGMLGLVTVSASLAVLVWAAEPVVIVLLGAIWLRERVALGTSAAVGAALGGVLLVVYQAGASGDLRGIVLTTAAVTACAVYTVGTRRLLLEDSSLVVVLYQQLAAWVLATLLTAVAAATGLARVGLPPDAATWALAVVSGAIYYALAFWCFVGGLRRVPAAVAGSLLPAIPVFGLLAGYLAGDQLSGRQWLGAALVVTATAVAVVAATPRQAPP